MGRGRRPLQVERQHRTTASTRCEVGDGSVWSSGVGHAKTHEARTVMLPAFLADRLEKHIEGLAADDLVFTAPRGGPLRSSNFRRDV